MPVESLLSGREFVEQLDREAEERGLDIRKHPFPQAVYEGRASLESIKEFAKLFYLLSSRGPRQMLIKLYYCQDPELAQELAANIYEEFTGKLSGTAEPDALPARDPRRLQRLARAEPR
jgi:pyrroloquinoline quinone (PQQ) biosynthesis protein C